MRGPGYAGLDMGLSKRWQIHEAHSVLFRWEVFNVPEPEALRCRDHHEWDRPGAGIRHLQRIADQSARDAVCFAVRVLGQWSLDSAVETTKGRVLPPLLYLRRLRFTSSPSSSGQTIRRFAAWRQSGSHVWQIRALVRIVVGFNDGALFLQNIDHLFGFLFGIDDVVLPL